MHRLICFLGGLFLACSPGGNEVSPDMLYMDFDISRETGLGADDIECVFIPLETNDDCLLSLFFDDIQFYDDKIFIINSHNNVAEVFVFSHEGQFITKIGRVGEGPGEYQQPYKLYINKEKNTITVADRVLNSLQTYSLDDYRYLSAHSTLFNFSTCIWLTDDRILWCSDGGFDDGKRTWHYPV